MRYVLMSWLALAAALVAPSAAQAQQKPTLRLKIATVRVGFQGSALEEQAGIAIFKPGLWAPVHITLVPAPDGDIQLPLAPDDSVSGELLIETADSDGLNTAYRQPFGPLRKQDRIELESFVKPGATGPEVRVSVRADARGKIQGSTRPNPYPTSLQLQEHLYVTLGARLPQLSEALLDLSGTRKLEKEKRTTAPRYSAREDEAVRLPTAWHGYNAADLVILTTGNEKFVKELAEKRNEPRVRALADWVRRGGRLVVSVSWANQTLVHRLLGPAYWDPPLPPMLTENSPADHTVKTFHGVEEWVESAGLDRKRRPPFFRAGDEPLRVARLKPHESVQVEVAEQDGPPLILRTPYGLGSVTVLAFDVENAPFANWGDTEVEKGHTVAEGAAGFWAALLKKMAPRAAAPRAEDQLQHWPGEQGLDLSTQLSQQLEVFDSPPIGFGWVALFILLYILVVGPLDYFILKKVFNRLEWTWVTFPTVVIAVSLIAYMTAHAIKGKELKINKVDLLDIDQRTELDGKLNTARARVYGTSWFTVLSPRIESYSVGLEPVFPVQMGGDAKAPATRCLVSWLGRPEGDGMGAFGRPRSQGVFSRAYEYDLDAAGLKDVPIPVWTTKAFTASWEAPLAKLPFTADLRYEPGGDGLTGTIKSNLPADLRDVRLIYGNKFYPLGDMTAGGAPVVIDLEKQQRAQREMQSWDQDVPGQGQILGPDDLRGGTQYNPWPVVRRLLFNEQSGMTAQGRNHAQRPLDQSWRIVKHVGEVKSTVREAILVGRLPRARGSAEALHQDNDPSLPTHLWLKDLPGEGRARPEITGTLYQDTVVRVFLPVTPVPAK